MKKTIADILYEEHTFGMPYEDWLKKMEIRRRIAAWGDRVYPVGRNGKKLKGWNKIVKEAKQWSNL